MNRKAWIALCTAASTFVWVGASALPSSPVLAATTSTSQPVLQLGDQGAAVKTLQTDLNLAGYSVGTPDGIFGPATQSSVEKFQGDHKLGVDGVVGPATWQALTSAMGPNASDLHDSAIYFNGHLVTSPKAFAWNNTTYMPIYYVMQLLNTIHVQSSWNGKQWSLTAPSTQTINVSGLPLNQPKPGQQEILLNGTPVAYVNSIDFPDPASNVDTTYMPIWYIMQALSRLQFKTASWDGVTWQLANTSVYYAYDKTGKEIAGPYQTEADAQAQLANVPGGTVRDDSGTVEFTEPDFTAYSANGTTIGDYTTLAAAEAALANVPGGTVKDSTGKVVYTAAEYQAFTSPSSQPEDFTTLAAAEAAVAAVPGAFVEDSTGKIVYTVQDFKAFVTPTSTPTDYTTLNQAISMVSSSNIGYVVDVSQNRVVYGPVNYDYLDSSGNWQNSQTGSIGPAPSFAQPGYKYVSVNTSTSSSPQFYLIEKADGTYVGQAVSSTTTNSQNPFQTVDLRFPAPTTVTVQQIDQFLQSNGSPLAGLGQSFISAQNTYGVDATYLVAHSILETGWGKSSIAQAKNNLFGYGAYDTNPADDAGMFPTNDYAIRFEAWVVRYNYLEPTGSYYSGPTLNGMNVNYATDPLWSQNIANIMSQYVATTGGSASQYTQFSYSNTPPIPAVQQEPVFLVHGAQGSIMQNPYITPQYPNGALPVWSNPATGSQQMFPGVLQYGDSGRGVQLLQEALINSDLQPDGQFGPLTQSAVEQWQQSHGLPVTGICDFNTWLSLFPAPSTSIPEGTTVTIDQMRQGMVGNLVILWYHVTAANGVSGWVDSQYVSPQETQNGQVVSNIFRVTPTSGYTVPVYADETGTGTPVATYHSGDEVVLNSLVPVNTAVAPDSQGFIPIQWVNQQTGQASVGYMNASTVQLTPLTPPANSTTTTSTSTSTGG